MKVEAIIVITKEEEQKVLAYKNARAALGETLAQLYDKGWEPYVQLIVEE